MKAVFIINIKRQRGDAKETNVRGIGFQTSGADVAAKPWVLTPYRYLICGPSLEFLHTRKA